MYGEPFDRDYKNPYVNIYVNQHVELPFKIHNLPHPLLFNNNANISFPFSTQCNQIFINRLNSSSVFDINL